MGIDPGTNQLGYAIVDCYRNDQFRLVEMSVVHMGHLDNQAEKLKKIFEKLDFTLKAHRPDQVAIEAPFFGKNVQSMLKLGRAQGVAMAVAMVNDIQVTEYSPKKIKQSVTGNGNASKEQVAAMLEQLLRRKLDLGYLDSTDALGVAICHHFCLSNPLSGMKSAKSWDAFLKTNPSRLVDFNKKKPKKG